MNQVLTQDEINSLLKGLSEGEVETDEAGGEEGKNLKRFDLANQERIIRGRMPTMEIIHDRFARQFRTSLSKLLGRTTFASVGGIEMVKFGLFMKRLPLPSSLHIFRMPPLSGYALMVASSPLVFGIIDSMFGGSGQKRTKVEGREYTPIEVRLIGKVVMMALDILRDAWAPIHPVDFVYVRSEFNPLAVAIVPPTDVVITVTVEIELEQDTTQLIICTPYSTVEPLRGKLAAGFQSTRLEVDSRIAMRLNSNISRTPAEVSVQLADGAITARKLIGLNAGDVLTLDSKPSDPALVKIEGTPKFYATVGTSSGQRAARIQELIPLGDLINYRNRQEMIINGK